MKTHQKMCWNCDGHVHIYELQCPYCGADLTEHETIEDREEVEDEASERTFVHKLAEKEPSYEPPEAFQEALEAPPFQDLIEDVKPIRTEEEIWEHSESHKEEDLDNPLASLLLLLPGSLFFLFGLALCFFSEGGFLVFKFKTKYWFVYLMGSWPLLYFGWRSLFPAKPLSQERSVPKEPLDSPTSDELIGAEQEV